ncbi:hypothetical protein F5878DRAFT_666702 [Lentinula raphanica]|uniref:Secreted protein n=1 Tax=Lentinula raphanica TaxID=153919 RepID=A0AA38U4N2_9AGAR|nr:hypothetical protein EV360DRAFT_79245 [Lentinula raphanica]KAJ3832302.1 hypothetical protein F5878DRAFT_666702 [Lentinula raphanica]
MIYHTISHPFRLLSLLFAAILTSEVASIRTPHLAPRQATDADFFNPLLNGGSMLDQVPGVLGEPLNVIISAQSSPDVLTLNGIINFAKAIGFSTECLGIHSGAPQSANLGDGNGWVNQTIELREDYGDADLGTCLESLIGGNHFRVFVQNGTEHPTGALFLAVSTEENVTEGHTTAPDGYDTGRDLFSAAAINNGGTTSFGGTTYSTVGTNITGLIQPGSTGIEDGIATDGIVTLLTVTIV